MDTNGHQLEKEQTTTDYTDLGSFGANHEWLR